MDTLKNTSVFNDITLLDDNEDYHMISMDEVEEKEIQWLIPNYIPKEQITLIVGDGGLVRQPLGPALYQHYQKESYVSLKIKKKIKENL